MPRNNLRSGKGRASIARHVMFNATGNTNAMYPQQYIMTNAGVKVKAGYFGGMKKGGSQPSATGFMTPSHSMAATQVAYSAAKPNYLFNFRTNPGPRPWGNAPHP